MESEGDEEARKLGRKAMTGGVKGRRPGGRPRKRSLLPSNARKT